MRPQPLSIEDAAREFPNDYDLGEYLRDAYKNSLKNTSEVHEMIREYPNNYKLGSVARLQALHN